MDNAIPSTSKVMTMCNNKETKQTSGTKRKRKRKSKGKKHREPLQNKCKKRKFIEKTKRKKKNGSNLKCRT